VTFSQRNPGVVAYGAGDLRVVDLGTPTAEADEALVQIALGGICGSDLHYWQHGGIGDSVIREPLVLGHEVVGTVLREAADGSGPAPGTRVAVHPGSPGASDDYPVDRANLSPTATYLGSAREYPHSNGGFARIVALPSRMLRPLDRELSLSTAVIAEPASVAWHAVERAGGVRGKRVLVIGCGPIGALVVAVLRHHGAAEITAVDLYEQPMAIARSVGASRTISATDADAVRSVRADIAIESSGSVAGFGSALSGLRSGGRLVLVGMPPGGEQPVRLAEIVAREIEVVGSFRFNDEIDAVLGALSDGSLSAEPLVTHTFPVDDAVEAFRVAADSARSGKVLLDFGDTE
jgi:L-idonate 5-dehydrogenase